MHILFGSFMSPLGSVLLSTSRGSIDNSLIFGGSVKVQLKLNGGKSKYISLLVPDKMWKKDTFAEIKLLQGKFRLLQVNYELVYKIGKVQNLY